MPEYEPCQLSDEEIRADLEALMNERGLSLEEALSFYLEQQSSETCDDQDSTE